MKIVWILVLLCALGCSQAERPAPTDTSAVQSRHSSFLMPIDDVFALNKRGSVVVVGVVTEGTIRPGDSLTIESDQDSRPVLVEALEAYHKPLQSAKAGDQVGVMLQGVDKEQVTLPATLASNSKEDTS